MSNVKFLKSFIKSVDNVLSYISTTSPQNAKKFHSELKSEIDKIAQNPTANPPLSEKASFRYRTFKRNYKIIFKISPPFVKFVKLFHTKQNPDKIWD